MNNGVKYLTESANSIIIIHINVSQSIRSINFNEV